MSTTIVSSISGLPIYAPSAAYAPTNGADVSAITSAYAESAVSGVVDTVSSNSASWGQGGVDSATVSAIASAYGHSALSSIYAGPGISYGGADDPMIGINYDGAGPLGTNDNNVLICKTDGTTIGVNNAGELVSLVGGGVDSATVSAIASGYAESAVSSKADASALSAYAFSSDVSGVIDTVSSNSASWAGGSLPITGSAGDESATYDVTGVEYIRNDTAGEPDKRTASFSPDQMSITYTVDDNDYYSVSINETGLNFSDPDGYYQVAPYDINNWNSAFDTVSANSASWGGGGATGDYVEKSALEVPIGSGNAAASTAFAQGNRNSAMNCSFAQGSGNSATGYSFAQGYNNIAIETYSFAQGNGNSAHKQSFAQGISNMATADSFAQGSSNIARSLSFAQGNINYASGFSFAQGGGNTASSTSFAQGERNTAKFNSFAQGYYNSAINTATVFGKYNLHGDGSTSTGNSAAFAIGDGTGTAARHDLMLVTKDGEITMYSSTADTVGLGLVSAIKAISAAATGGGGVVTATGSASATAGSFWPPTTSYLVSSINGSALLPYGYSALSSNSANWTLTNSAVSANSANWNSVYNTVNSNSASWSGSTGGGYVVSPSGTIFVNGSSIEGTNSAVLTADAGEVFETELYPQNTHVGPQMTMLAFGSVPGTGATLMMQMEQAAYNDFQVILSGTGGNGWASASGTIPMGTLTASVPLEDITGEISASANQWFNLSNGVLLTAKKEGGIQVTGVGELAWKSAVDNVTNTVSANSATWGQGGVDSATVSAIASSYAESAASSKLDTSAQVVTSTASAYDMDGYAWTTEINGLEISAAKAYSASYTNTAETAYSADFASSSDKAIYDTDGRFLSSLTDSATVSAIASSYAESAVSGKMDGSAVQSAYASASATQATANGVLYILIPNGA